MEEYLNKFFAAINLVKTKDISGTYFEQKITPDLLSFAAECILQVTRGDLDKVFTCNDIRTSGFYKKVVEDYFNKPADSIKTNNEYNKLIQYQLGLLCFCGALRKCGFRSVRYKVVEPEIIKYLAVHERQALAFLTKYVDKFLQDNSLLNLFEVYHNEPSQSNYLTLKEEFWFWAHRHTNVRTLNPAHTRRVFNKIFNIYCYARSIPGETLNRVGIGPNPYLNLIYNRINFRDTKKAKNIARQEYLNAHDFSEDRGYLGYLITKAKRAIKKRYSTTELPEYQSEGNAMIQAHHIFPANVPAYTEFASSPENLISVTPGQHYSHAHRGSTSIVEPTFQLKALLRRLDTIEESTRNDDGFFNLQTFISMLNICLKLGIPTDASYKLIRDRLNERLNTVSS